MKHRKTLLLFFTFMPILVGYSQSFYLPVPVKWTTETIQFPIDFAPKISYTGEEHLRFSPSWGDTKSDELWSYCFLWWIPADSKITKESLDTDIQSYYGGLVARNIIRRKIDSTHVVLTLAEFKVAKAEKGESQAFTGTVKMLDYMGLKPITLQISVHVIPCTKEGKLGVFFEVSPQPRTHAIWKQFKFVRDGFRCSN